MKGFTTQDENRRFQKRTLGEKYAALKEVSTHHHVREGRDTMQRQRNRVLGPPPALSPFTTPMQKTIASLSEEPAERTYKDITYFSSSLKKIPFQAYRNSPFCR